MVLQEVDGEIRSLLSRRRILEGQLAKVRNAASRGILKREDGSILAPGNLSRRGGSQDAGAVQQIRDLPTQSAILLQISSIDSAIEERSKILQEEELETLMKNEKPNIPEITQPNASSTSDNTLRNILLIGSALLLLG